MQLAREGTPIDSRQIIARNVAGQTQSSSAKLREGLHPLTVLLLAHATKAATLSAQHVLAGNTLGSRNRHEIHTNGCNQLAATGGGLSTNPQPMHLHIQAGHF